MVRRYTWEARIIAFLWRKRVKWLVRLKGPVSHFPGGTMSCAPPSDACRLRLLIAFRKALVLDLTPSPTPPKSVKTALCFLQLMASYSLPPFTTLHSATFTFSDPNIRTKQITPITCTQKHQQTPSEITRLKHWYHSRKKSISKIHQPKVGYQNYQNKKWMWLMRKTMNTRKTYKRIPMSWTHLHCLRYGFPCREEAYIWRIVIHAFMEQ